MPLILLLYNYISYAESGSILVPRMEGDIATSSILVELELP
jgi:hypothetical protein